MKKMMIINLLISFLFITGTTNAGLLSKDIKGNGNVIKEERNVGDFKGVSVGGAFDVYLKKGNNISLEIEADENILPAIKTEVKGDILKVSTTENIRNSTKLNIYITMPELEKLDISGACDLKGEGLFSMNKMEMDASGASSIKLEIDADYLELEMSGSSEIDLSGKVRESEIELSGASELNAFNLITEKCDIDASGASSADIYVNNELEVDASGASNIDYKGDATSRADVSGAASLKKK